MVLVVVAILVVGVLSVLPGTTPARATIAAAPQAAAPAAAPRPGTQGIGDDYFPLDGNGGIDVRRYEIHDTYDFARRRLSGWTRLTIRATQSLSSFDLDLLLPVRGVTVAGRPAALGRPHPHELRIRPATPIR